jgi:hypothetical protein
LSGFPANRLPAANGDFVVELEEAVLGTAAAALDF